VHPLAAPDQRDLLGGGRQVRTGPTIVDKTNVDQIAKFASAGTR
jgi:hypothetical protein